MGCDPRDQTACAEGTRCISLQGDLYGQCLPDKKGLKCVNGCFGGFECETVSLWYVNDRYCVGACNLVQSCRANEKCVNGGCQPDCKKDVFSNACSAFEGSACFYLGGPDPIVCRIQEGGGDSKPCAAERNCAPGFTCGHDPVGCRPYCNLTHPCSAGRDCYIYSSSLSSLGICIAPCESPGVDCTTPNRSICTVQNGAAVCSCNPGFINGPNGSCISANLCSPNPCTMVNKTQCANQGGAAVCSCDPGYVPGAGGSCVLFNPCSPNPCTTANKTQCSNQGGTAVCGCDPGYTAGAGGTCVLIDPCVPNPCAEPNKTVCTSVGTSFSCGCVAGTTAYGNRCVPSCPAEHATGDGFEPNECAAAAAPLTLTIPGSSAPISNPATFGPTTSDVDFYTVLTEPNHGYLALGLGSNVTCTGFVGSLAASPYDRFVEWQSGAGPTPWSCSIGSSMGSTSYSQYVLDFDLSDGDYPAASFFPIPAARRFAANTFPSGDMDGFRFTVSQNTTLKVVSIATLSGDVSTYNPQTGMLIQSLPFSCGGSFAGSGCVTITVTGTAEVRVKVSSASFGTPINLYQFTW